VEAAGIIGESAGPMAAVHGLTAEAALVGLIAGEEAVGPTVEAVEAGSTAEVVVAGPTGGDDAASWSQAFIS
jgi:hypothetical protein